MSEHAIANAKGWFATIGELVANADDDDEKRHRAIERIHEGPLAVQVRSDWYNPGCKDSDARPIEHKILLTTGGPALRLTGDLSAHGEPETARLEWQDWGTRWIGLDPKLLGCSQREADEILLAYVSHFWFGE